MVTKTAVVLRHVAFEDLGNFTPVLVQRGYAIEVLDAGVDELAAAIARADLVVVLGGTIGAYEGDRYPWLKAELGALAARLAERRPTLGICLGSQLLAAALGARVYRGPRKEIGVAELQLTSAGRASSLRELEGQAVFHWHGDTFELPRGAERLASTAAYENQAFALGENVLALQFHAELDSRRFEQWLIAYGGELDNMGIAQLRAEVEAAGQGLCAAGQRLLSHWLDGLRV
jgi:GMP synthase (glutamine-hydrolysing)